MKKIIITTAVVLATSSSLMAVSFASCAACHGSQGEKSALGKSQIIKGWTAEKVIEALNGYKSGTYGGPMKGIMKGQVARLSQDDIKALAEQISKF